MRRIGILNGLAGIGLLLGALGCATRGPEVEQPPTAVVDQLASTVMTPEVVRFQAKVVIRNRMRSSMDFERVDYAVDLYDTELFTSSFDGLKVTKGGGIQTVTLPFQIAMSDIAAQAVDLLAEGSMRVSFRGRVYPEAASGFAPIPFARTVTIPIPRIPEVSFAGTEGVPLSDSFRVILGVRNLNSFDLSVESVESYLEINERQYPLLYTLQSTHIGAGLTGTVTLHLEHTPGRSLSMVLNALQSTNPSFSVGGSITARTPYGWIYIPVRIEAAGS